MEVRLAKDYNEVEACIIQACSIFHSPSTKESYKNFLWHKTPGFHPGRVILLTDNRKIFGFLRVIPQKIHFPGKLVHSAALSSIAILPEYRGQGLSNMLMTKSLDLCRNEGFDFAHLIARKAVDHYYCKFGFLGISSYEKLYLQSAFLGDTSELRVEKIHDRWLKFCSEAYDFSYAQCVGKMVRSGKFWQYSKERLDLMPGLHWSVVTRNSVPLAYLIYDNVTIHELGMSPDLQDYKCIFGIDNFGSIRTLNIPFTHSIYRLFDTSVDYRQEQRKCLFGGHMMCDLNYKGSNELKEIEIHFLNTHQISIANQKVGEVLNFSFLDQL